MRSVAVLLVVVLGLVGAVPPSHSSKAIVPDEGKQSPIPTIAKNLKPKQRDNRRPAGFRPALDLRPLSLAKDQANYPLFTGEGTENPNNMKKLVAKLKAEPYGSGSMLDPFKEFLQRFWNRVEATADLEVGCNADFTSTIGANSGRTVTFGTATISKLAVEPPWGYADADAGRRLNAWIEPLALSTGLLGSVSCFLGHRVSSCAWVPHR